MRWIVIVSILVFMAALYRRSLRASKKEVRRESGTTEMVQDPNCATFIPANEAYQITLDGQSHFFCSEKCAKEYREKQGRH